MMGLEFPPVYEMASLVILVTLFLYLPFYGLLRLLFRKSRVCVRILIICYFAYSLWWEIDVLLFYYFGRTSLGHRALICYLLYPPTDSCSPLVNIQLNPNQYVYTTFFAHKYEGSYTIGLGDGETFMARVLNEDIKVQISFLNSAGDVLKEDEIIPLRNPFSNELESHLTREYSTEVFRPFHEKLELKVLITGDLNAFIANNPGATLFVKRRSVY